MKPAPGTISSSIEFSLRLLDSSFGAGLVLDLEFRVLAVNAAGAALLGFAGDQGLGRTLWNLFPDISERQCTTALAGGRWFESATHYADGAPGRIRVTGSADCSIAWLEPPTDRAETRFEVGGGEVALPLGRFLDSLREGILIASSTGAILATNPAALAMLGLQSANEIESAVEELATVHLQGCNTAGEEHVLRRALRGEIITDCDLKLKRRDQSEVSISLSSNVLRDEEGKISATVISMRDITAETHAEAALRQSEEQRRLALDSAGLGTWFWDLEEDRIYWSNRCREMFGLRPTEPVTLERFFEALHPDDREMTKRAIEASISMGIDFSAEYRVITEGSTRWMHAWGRTDRGGTRRMQGVIADVDARKRVERALQQTTDTLRAIVEASPIAIITLDDAGQVTNWNPAAEAILGYRREAMLGQALPFDLLLDGRRHNFDRTLRRADGNKVDVSFSIAPMSDSSESGHIVLIDDITERTRLRQQMEHAQRLESLGVLAGGIAHDFNNLLTGILGNASLGLYVLPPEDPARPLLEDVVGASERAADLTRQLLAYAGKGRFVIELLDLSTAVQEAAALAGASLRRQGIRVKTEFANDLPLVSGDRVQLHQLIINLLMNAVEAIPEDGTGTIFIRTFFREIREGSNEQQTDGGSIALGGYSVLEVSDTGTGIDDATLIRIFEPFFSTKFIGRGLGLSAVLGIVRGHHGALQVESRLGEGSSFRVLIPAAGTEEPWVGELGSVAAEERRTVLVIDDEETVRSTLKRLLERKFDVIFAENGQAGVEVFSALADSLSAVILDLTMPVMNGEQTLRLLQRIRPNIPVFLTSGYDELAAKKRLGRQGFAGFLQKPLVPERLFAMLEGVGGAELASETLGVLSTKP